jgi:translation initiation factor 4E
MWDDPNNENGGRWFIPSDRFSRHSKLDNHWTEVEFDGWCCTIRPCGHPFIMSHSSPFQLIMAMVGEQFGSDSDYVCGAVVSLRFKVDKISLWTRDAITPEGKQANKRIGAIIKEKLGLSQKESDEMRYEEHREAFKRSQMRRPI